MRAKGIPVQQIILGLALLAGLCWNLAHASEINDLRVSAGAIGTRAEIGLDSQVEYKILTLSNPERLVVDLPGVDPVRGLERSDVRREGYECFSTGRSRGLRFCKKTNNHY